MSARGRSKSTSDWENLLAYEGPVVNVLRKSESLPVESRLSLRSLSAVTRTPQVLLSGKSWDLLSVQYAPGAIKQTRGLHPGVQIAVILNVRRGITKSVVFQVLVWTEDDVVKAKILSGTMEFNLLKFNTAAKEFLSKQEVPELELSDVDASNEAVHKAVLLSLGV